MLYLHIFHIDEYARHLKENNVLQVYLSHDLEAAHSPNATLNEIVFSARVNDYIVVCPFGISHKPDSSFMEQVDRLKKEANYLKERLEGHGLSVTLGHWTTETPTGLRNG